MPVSTSGKSDRARGKAGTWTVWWVGEDAKRRSRPGVTDKARSLEPAKHLAAEARRVRAAIVEPGELTRHEVAPPHRHRSRRGSPARPAGSLLEKSHSFIKAYVNVSKT